MLGTPLFQERGRACHDEMKCRRGVSWKPKVCAFAVKAVHPPNPINLPKPVRRSETTADPGSDKTRRRKPPFRRNIYHN